MWTLAATSFSTRRPSSHYAEVRCEEAVIFQKFLQNCPSAGEEKIFSTTTNRRKFWDQTPKARPGNVQGLLYFCSREAGLKLKTH